MTPRTLAVVALIALAAPMLSGCVSMAIGAAATTGVAAAEERTMGDVVDDFTTNAQINGDLFAYSERLFQDVSIDVTEGRVLLTGKVPSPDDRVDAVRIAWQTDGVVEVINEIQVTETGGVESYLNDVRISNELRADLLFDGGVDSINYNVETVGGIIYLTGIARNQAELDLVVDHARTISGVKEIISHVRVKSS
ncbi:MAG: BON domain-containing protein [Alphaproteobacteria bacterium]|jgi:osmotically-inducible protein OsmY|nr:BON domain-containing protein [Rhodospirillaceae bacterium]MDG2482680.1 BON domain-containing protein [Alphaproteobacteria bacterium]MBT6204509.1 BON domain-containing protein [Rhodospirillaceae bacterium]MBT6509145.1 BON domain-containing protein [Rhodospirillaceae bacterium]MBT7612343.1 BON domain-containing protein [Rhodospirillaceae bacterium]